ncbi:hypothetical protein [Planctomycetes bacterium TBK1r]
MSLIYLDTARLGQACPQASQAQLDFCRLSAEDPSMYCEQFFRDGTVDWSEDKRLVFPSLAHWHGLRTFKTQIARRFGVSSPEFVLLANRSAQLVRLAARLMFRKCRNVLTTDLNWPSWQNIVCDEAVRCGQRLTNSQITPLVFSDQASADDVNERLAQAFTENGCDGVFLPAVTNLGVRLDTSSLLAKLKANGGLRFAMIDSAQSFCHIASPAPLPFADFTIAGCHKWLRGSLPLGLGICGRSIVAEQFRDMLASTPSLFGIDDPLLRFSEQIEHQAVDRYSETVNVTPLFSGNAAIVATDSGEAIVAKQACKRTANAELIRKSVPTRLWQPVETDTSMNSGIVLLQSKSHNIVRSEPNVVRSKFLEKRVAISAYKGGLVRLSAPESIDCQMIESLQDALVSVA